MKQIVGIYRCNAMTPSVAIPNSLELTLIRRKMGTSAQIDLLLAGRGIPCLRQGSTSARRKIEHLDEAAQQRSLPASIVDIDDYPPW